MDVLEERCRHEIDARFNGCRAYFLRRSSGISFNLVERAVGPHLFENAVKVSPL
jgi:hypothetical protein